MREVFEKYNGDNSETKAVDYLQSQVNSYYNKLLYSNKKTKHKRL